MKQYYNVHCQNQPQAIEITDTLVFVNKNIIPYTRDNIQGYEYDVDVYDKNEYIMQLVQNQQDISALKEELEAAKILLGVE